MNDQALLHELVRGEAPGSMLKAEGFTEREIRAAKIAVSLDTAREGNSEPAASRPTQTPASGQRGATASVEDTTHELEGSRDRGLDVLGAREPARAAHSGITGGAASD